MNLAREIACASGTHPLHQRLFNTLVALCAITISTRAILGAQDPKTYPGDNATFECKQSPFGIVVPLHGLLEYMLANRAPSIIPIGIIHAPGKMHGYSVFFDVNDNRVPIKSETLNAAYANLISPIFMEFYEYYRQWMFDHVGHPNGWPSVWQFGRIVRNSIAHNGRVKIDDKDALPVSWYGVSYACANNGTAVIGGDLLIADVLLLMIEMSEVLVARSCPTVLQ